MPNTIQEFFANGALKQMGQLEAALDRVPVEKRNWSAMGDARTALDQAAECAILNGSTADLIAARAWPADFDMTGYAEHKAKLATDEAAVRAMLKENTARVAETIRALPDADLGIEVQMPWGPMTLTDIVSYPYWNMSYHEGQINYIASMLGCLE